MASWAALSKSLNVAFAAGEVTELPKLLDQVQKYIDAHPEPSDADRQKMQELLVEIHHQHVSGAKNAAFLSVLRLLKRDFILEAEACGHWWNVLVLPLIDTTIPLKQTVKDARDLCLETIVVLEDDPMYKVKMAAADLLRRKILETYFAATSLQRTRLASNLEALLIAYAQTRTREFFDAIDPYFCDPAHRLQCLSLLSTFVRLQTQYLYQSHDSPLFGSLLQCLENDTSTSVISLALTVCVMLIPHIPDKLSSMLARIFAIFGRILCWDRLRAVRRRASAIVETGNASPPEHSGQVDTAAERWRTLDASFDHAQPTPPRCAQLFTFLYGLYPINFIDYLKEPTRYLSTHGKTHSDLVDVDDETIRDRAEIMIRRHLLHVNFATLDIDSEVLDKTRWLKMDPSDVVSMCVGYDRITANLSDAEISRPAAVDGDVDNLRLDSGTASGTISPPDDNPVMSDSFTSDRGTTSRLASPAFRPASAGADISRMNSTRSSLVSAADILKVHEGLMALEAAQNTHPLLPEGHALHAGRDDTALTLPPDSDAARYQREVLLLRNELNFERHLKQQHLHHIGRLQRSNIANAAMEAERQGLCNTNKSLKSQLSSLQTTLQRLRHENATGKANRTQYEATLNERIKKLRSENTELRQVDGELRTSLAESRADIEILRESLARAEGSALNLKQQLAAFEPEIQAAKDVQKNLDALQNRMKQAEIDTIRLRMERERVDVAEARVKEIELELAALKAEHQQSARRGQQDEHALLTLQARRTQPTAAPIRAGLVDEISDALRQAAARHARDHEKQRARADTLSNRCNSLESQLSEALGKVEYLQMKHEHEARRSAQATSADNTAVAVMRSRAKGDGVRRASLAPVQVVDENVEPPSSPAPSAVDYSSNTVATHGQKRTDKIAPALSTRTSETPPLSRRSSATPSTPGSVLDDAHRQLGIGAGPFGGAVPAQSARPRAASPSATSTTSAASGKVAKPKDKSLGGRFRW